MPALCAMRAHVLGLYPCLAWCGMRPKQPKCALFASHSVFNPLSTCLIELVKHIELLELHYRHQNGPADM